MVTNNGSNIFKRSEILMRKIVLAFEGKISLHGGKVGQQYSIYTVAILEINVCAHGCKRGA